MRSRGSTLLFAAQSRHTQPVQTRFLDRLRIIAVEALDYVGAPARDELLDIRGALDEPLHVLVAGRAKSGKSTLVNALLGLRVAPTGTLETTRVPAVFRYGARQTAELVLRDGRRNHLPFADTMLPSELGHPIGDVDFVDVRLSATDGILQRLTMGDAPGSDTLTKDVENAAWAALGLAADGRRAGRRPDVVLFTLTPELLDVEIDVMRRFQRASPHAGSAATAVGVLSRADLIGEATDMEDPLAPAARLAEEHLRRCRGALAQILPVIGLLAETAETAALTHDDGHALGLLADADPAVLDVAMLTSRRFMSAELPGIGADQRKRLLTALDLFGIRDATGYLRSVGDRGLAGLRHHLSTRSGFAAVRAALLDDFAARADAIKARHAIERLNRLLDAVHGDARSKLARGLDELQQDRQLHELAVLEAWARVRCGHVPLPQSLQADLERMASGGALTQRLGVRTGDAASVRAAILAGNRRWSALEASAAPSQAAVAATMRTAYTLAFTELTAR
jgi:hypothetical protein